MLCIILTGLILIAPGSPLTYNLEDWIKQDTLPESFFSAPVSNVLRCGKLCERQGKCVGASFNVRENICHLHDSSLPSGPAPRVGKYLYRSVQREPQNVDTNQHECSNTQIGLPSAKDGEEACHDIGHVEVQHETGQPTVSMMTRDATTTPVEEVPSTPENINPCWNNQTFNGTDCLCELPFYGEYCEKIQRDCNNITDRSWYDVLPEDGKGKITVFCWEQYLYAFVADEHGFAPEYLNLTWMGYKLQFGGLRTNGLYADRAYWLGNENIHRITSGTLSYKLNYYIHDPNVKFGDYTQFRVSSETYNYAMRYQSYATTDNVDQVLINGQPFSAFDRDENGCATKFNTGFWFDQICSPYPPILGSVKVGGVRVNYTHFWASLIRM